MYFTNQQNFEQERVTKIQGKLKTVRDSIKTDAEKNAGDNYFSLQHDDNAREYFEGQDIDAIGIKVRDAIYAKNAAPGGNTLVGYPEMQLQK